MIGLVFIGNIEFCPYLEKYISILSEEKIKYDILFWNRDMNNKKYPKNYFYYTRKSKLNKKKIFKVFDFINYQKWLKEKIIKKNYDKIIILDTLSGILISRILLTKYKRKYLFDIRDYSYEKISVFYNIEKKLIYNSFFTCISSEGFKEFLPKDYDYIITHNFSYRDINMAQNGFIKNKKYGDTLNLVWLGSIRYFNHQIQIINKLKDDQRFNIIFHGIGPDYEKFLHYSKINSIKNIEFTGRYENNDKSILLSNADLINNSYDIRNGYEVKYAIANKFYDGLIYKIPQLVEVDTYKGKKATNIGVGISIDANNKDFANILYNYYFNIDIDNFNECCTLEMKKVISDDKKYINKILSFINEGS